MNEIVASNDEISPFFVYFEQELEKFGKIRYNYVYQLDFWIGNDMKIIEYKSFDEERALYGERGLRLVGCRFTGDADGESAFKEGGEIECYECYFNLRYPFWHNETIKIENSQMTTLCRAPIWYSRNVKIKDTLMHGTKAVRESENITIENSDIISEEFGWFCNSLTIENSIINGAYFMLRSHDIKLSHSSFQGKYSFQYIKNALIEDCTLDTKDAFWHASDVIVKNCIVKGEYLGWYSSNVTFENCRIIGTQPLCYCTGLTLINCEMIDCDLAFENSDVNAEITTPVISIKNPRCGKIFLPEVMEIIYDAEEKNCVINVG